jgi:hypothetical protein
MIPQLSDQTPPHQKEHGDHHAPERCGKTEDDEEVVETVASIGLDPEVGFFSSHFGISFGQGASLGQLIISHLCALSAFLVVQSRPEINRLKNLWSLATRLPIHATLIPVTSQ